MTRASVIRKISRELIIDIEPETASASNSSQCMDVASSSCNINVTHNNARSESCLIESLLQMHCPGALRYNNTLEYELQMFKEAPTYTDPLAFWKQHNNAYPKLAAIANVVLAFPLTSSMSEGSFSVSGCTIRSRRSSITPTRVERVLFIHDNFHLLYDEK